MSLQNIKYVPLPGNSRTTKSKEVMTDEQIDNIHGKSRFLMKALRYGTRYKLGIIQLNQLN